MAGTLESWNARYFDGRLSPTCLALLTPLDSQHPEIVALADRSFSAMRAIGLRGHDVSELFGREMGHLLPKIHPRAWGGIVPPITLHGRNHEICARGENGYLGSVSPTFTPEQTGAAYAAIVRGLDEAGFVDRAVEVIRTAGIDAWRNPVGHVAVSPADLPEAARLH